MSFAFRRFALLAAVVALAFSLLSAAALAATPTRLTDLAPDRADCAVYSPDGSKIAFVRHGSPRALVVMNADGSAQTTVMPDLSGPFNCPFWSPTGTRLAFMYQVNTTGDIFAVDADGANLVNLTHSTGSELAFDPQWSPDGTKLAFGFRDEGALDRFATDVFTVNPDGSGLTKLTDDDPARPYAFNERWAPDGSAIYWQMGQDDIFRMDADGGNLTNLTHDSEQEQWFAVAPDGTIAFAETGGPAPDGLYTMDGDGNGVTPLVAPASDVSPARWSPDSSRLVYQRSDGVFTIKRDGTGNAQISNPPGRVLNPLDWSPDSARLVLVGLDPLSSDNDLFVASAAGGAPTPLVTGPGDQNEPDWSPVGSDILFLDGTPTQGDLFSVTAPTSVDDTSTSVPAGGTASTNDTVTADDPVGTAVTSPNAGPVSITEVASTSQPAPSGFSFLGWQVTIHAPDGSVANPLRLAFTLDASLLGGADETTIQLFRNGVQLADCDSGATPPCVSERTALAGGAIRLVVLTPQASDYNFAVHAALGFGGFLAPLKNAPAFTTHQPGSTIPVKFRVSPRPRVAVVAHGFPRSHRIDCATGADLGDDEPTSGKLVGDGADGSYHYNWKTDKSWGGGGHGPCRQLVVRLIDGTYHRANLRFK